MRLQTRFLLIYGLGSIIFLSVATTLVFINMQTSMIQQLKKQFLYHAENKFNHLQSQINDLISNLESTTIIPMFGSIRYHQLTQNQPAERDNLRQLELYFLEMQKNNSIIQTIQFIDTRGLEKFHIENNTIEYHHNYSLNNEVLAALKLKEDQIKINQKPETGSPDTFIIWIPVYVSNNVHMGILGFHIKFSFISNQISLFGKKDMEWACLYNEKNRLINSSHEAHLCSDPQDTIWVSKHTVNLANLNWPLIIQSDSHSYLEDVTALRWYIYGLILPLIAVISFLVIFITSKQITSSIKKIVYSARLLGSNQSYRPVNIRQADELNQLSTELNRAASLIQARTNELIQSNKELESYSYTIAHDLRTPLRTIAGFSDLLQNKAKDKLDTDEIESLNRIIQASHKMAELIDNTLELSRITRADISIEQVNLSDLAEQIFNDLTITKPEDSIEWHIAQGMTVNGDRQLLRILLENLLGNAWKYSRNVENAHIHFYSILQNDTHVYCIQDNGVGFDMKYVDNLFKPFERLHSHAEFEGSGIGLASAQRIVSKHHGHIWAESEPNKGTTVYFSLGDKSLNI